MSWGRNRSAGRQAGGGEGADDVTALPGIFRRSRLATPASDRGLREHRESRIGTGTGAFILWRWVGRSVRLLGAPGIKMKAGSLPTGTRTLPRGIRASRRGATLCLQIHKPLPAKAQPTEAGGQPRAFDFSRARSRPGPGLAAAAQKLTRCQAAARPPPPRLHASRATLPPGTLGDPRSYPSHTPRISKGNYPHTVLPPPHVRVQLLRTRGTCSEFLASFQAVARQVPRCIYLHLLRQSRDSVTEDFRRPPVRLKKRKIFQIPEDNKNVTAAYIKSWRSAKPR